jgi:hypothetical protein
MLGGDAPGAARLRDWPARFICLARAAVIWSPIENQDNAWTCRPREATDRVGCSLRQALSENGGGYARTGELWEEESAAASNEIRGLAEARLMER